MKSYLYIIILLISSNYSYSQEKIQFIDSLTRNPIPYVEIYFPHKQNPVISDSIGKIERKILASNKIIANCLGYKPKRILIDKNQNIIALSPKTLELDSVVINYNSGTEEYGYAKIRRTLFKSTFKIDNLIYLGVYIPNEHPEKTTYITSIIARIRTDNNKKNSKIRFHLYPFNPFSKAIGNQLLTRNLIFEVNSKKGIKNFKLKNESIEMPKTGVLVLVQLLNDTDTYIRIGKTKKLDSNINYHLPSWAVTEGVGSKKILNHHPLDKEHPLLIGIKVTK